MLRSIDVGAEWRIEPERWKGIKGLELEDAQYFSFLPNFVPRRLMRPFLAAERRLEESPARGYSVHCMAVLRKGCPKGTLPLGGSRPAVATTGDGNSAGDRDPVDRPIQSRIP